MAGPNVYDGYDPHFEPISSPEGDYAILDAAAFTTRVGDLRGDLLSKYNIIDDLRMALAHWAQRQGAYFRHLGANGGVTVYNYESARETAELTVALEMTRERVFAALDAAGRLSWTLNGREARNLSAAVTVLLDQFAWQGPGLSAARSRVLGDSANGPVIRSMRRPMKRMCISCNEAPQRPDSRYCLGCSAEGAEG